MFELARGSVTILDGALGTEIEARGIDVRNPLWGSVALLSEAGRAQNDAIHRDYRRAGAELLIANTHNASLGACARWLDAHGGDPAFPLVHALLADIPSEARPQALLRWLSAEAVASARRSDPLRPPSVAGCLASPDKPYSTRASLTPAQVAHALAAQRTALAEAGADLLVFEMLTTDSDLLGVAELASDGAAAPTAIGLVCGADGRTLGGVTMTEAVAALQAAQPVAYFVQCTRWDHVNAALEPLVTAVGGRSAVGVYANDGRSWDGREWHGDRVDAQRYSEEARGWIERGARIVGGCCGTGPAHVAALSQRFSEASGAW